jgi:smad nuclear-interacting protein 1
LPAAEEKSKTPYVRSQVPLPSQEAQFRRDTSGTEVIEKQLPNFNPTGVLAAASNTVAVSTTRSVVLKYHEPPEARKPPASTPWRLYVFKGKDLLETLELAERSCWLIGREKSVVDLCAEHPSISGQHAVLQFRWIEKRNEFGDRMGKVK